VTNFAAIPHEMRAYRQWICWRYEERGGEKPTKVPYNPVTGFMASVDDPNTWTDFETATKAATNPHYNGLGFVLTEHDPYCFIDLDGTSDDAVKARQVKIYEHFDSYTERSPSGTGAHIICKGHVPRGRKRSSVEVYSSLRYMTMTGDVWQQNKPITERQDLVMLLWSEMGKDNAGNLVAIDAPQTEDDNMIVVKAMNAANGRKFTDLLQGNWQIHYPHVAQAGQGPSEADFALIDMIAFYTQNRDQIRRIFMSSGLGQRDKVQKRPDYVNHMIDRSFDRMLPPQDFEMFKITAANIIAATNGQWSTETKTAATGGLNSVATVSASSNHNREAVNDATPALTHVNGHVNPYTFPPGLLGLIADYIYRSAPRPVAEIALAGAIGLMSGIAGRTYQTPTGVALNMYTLLIAKSGRGKEAMQQGIWRIMHAASRITPASPTGAVPAITQFIGPSDFRSDAALTKELSTRPCFVSIMGEFGLRMQAMVAPNVSSHLLGLRSTYLDLYHKADRTSQLSEMVYSDKDKNTKAVYRPSFSILAETTPSTYYQALSEALIMQGLLSRFFTIEYPGDRPDLEEKNIEPNSELVQSIAQLAVQCLAMMQQQKIVPVEFDKQAYDAQRAYNRRVDKHINQSESDTYAELWNRAHLKALKLSAMVSVGINPHRPIVTRDAWEWAQALVDRDVQNTVTKFETGEAGKIGGDDTQNRDLTDVIIDWLVRPWSEVQGACRVDEGAAYHEWHVIPHSYISYRCDKIGSFRNDKRGKIRAIYETLRNFEQGGMLTKYDKAYQFKATGGQTPFHGSGTIYMVKDEKEFRERAHGRRRHF
jgi:hypothetical protein